MRRVPFSIVLMLVLISSILAGRVLAVDDPLSGGGPYLGSGKFGTPNLSWSFSGTFSDDNGSYVNPITNAANEWSNESEINLTRIITGNWQVLATAQNYGDTGWLGYAYICSGATCNNQAAWDGVYSYCEARNNMFFLNNDPQNYRRSVAAHEFGHCWSLAHNRDGTNANVMYTGRNREVATGPNNTDNNNVNTKY